MSAYYARLLDRVDQPTIKTFWLQTPRILFLARILGVCSTVSQRLDTARHCSVRPWPCSASLRLVRRCGFFGLLLLASQPGTVAAQSASNQMAEVDPIRCWWRTSDGAVGVGQPFSLVLTCAVLETDARAGRARRSAARRGHRCSSRRSSWSAATIRRICAAVSGGFSSTEYRLAHHRPERDRPRRRVPADW